MSNKNLQKHLPRGLDEHNFQDGVKKRRKKGGGVVGRGGGGR